MPLVVKLEGGVSGGQRVSQTVRHVDILPTLLARAGVSSPDGVEGADLLGFLYEEALEPSTARRSYSHLGIDRRQLESLIVRGDEVIVDRSSPDRVGAGSQYLFDLVGDPAQVRNRLAEDPLRFRWLLQQIRAESIRRVTVESTEIEIPQELLEQLEALGYLK